MKTITAKDFQLNHSSVVRDVANGSEYEVTFHRKPLIRLAPLSIRNKSSIPGSKEALKSSLSFSYSVKGELHDLPYKQLRNRIIKQLHGD